MRTRFYIDIEGTKKEIPNQCIKNWDQIKCAYKRTDYSGVTRSFTSQFEFVGEAYDMLMSLYLEKGFSAEAVLYLYTIDDNWQWNEQFSAPVDFSTITWDPYTLRVNCIDNSMAALIKANKGTRYEFVVGTDIEAPMKLYYDRMTCVNTCTHEIMGNQSDATYGDYVDLFPSKRTHTPVFGIGEGETFENSPIVFSDQSTDDDSYFVEVKGDAYNVDFITEIRTDMHTASFDEVNSLIVYLTRAFDGVTSTTSYPIFSYEADKFQRSYLGVFASFDMLKERYPTAPCNSWALIGNSETDVKTAYVMSDGNVNFEWIECTPVFENRRYTCKTIVCRFSKHYDLLTAGNKFCIRYSADIDNRRGQQSFIAIRSSIKTRWQSTAKPITIDALSPKTVLDALLDKVSEGRFNIRTHIDTSDQRLPKTYLLAAESVRGIPGAKLYSTLQEYTEWMETVFGYSYYLGTPVKSGYVGSEPFDGTLATGTISDAVCPEDECTGVYFVEDGSTFAMQGSSAGDLYAQWPETSSYKASSEYNGNDGMARHDKVFVESTSGHAVSMGENGLLSYAGKPDRCKCDTQDVYFVPRTSLFDSTNTLSFSGVRDLRYTVNKDFVVSSVTVGYDKQDYETECGRDEWNFSAQYATGVNLSSKKMELTSKYRADCYGLEFLAQERAKDTTDAKDDNTVFFVHCAVDSRNNQEGPVLDRKLVIDRTAIIEGALTSSVFNGEYSPYRCVKANGGYIAAVMKNIRLKYASFDGNTEVRVDGISGNTDIQLDSQLFTAGVLEFTTGDISRPIDASALYKVEHNGIVYYGYLSEATVQFSRNEAVTYKLIVKEVIT